MNSMDDLDRMPFVNRLTTPYRLHDLVVSQKTGAAIHQMKNWLDAHTRQKKTRVSFTGLHHGFQAVFTGPSGTGKTFAASILGNESGNEVYRIDLSMVLSRFIGETEKNLSRLFEKAEKKNWILFFDEADALFGKRTGIRDSHDRYSNMGVSYLLQLVNYFSGLLILAFKKPLNPEFPFFKQSTVIVKFEKPDIRQRRKIWEKYLPVSSYENRIDLDEISRRYPLTGGMIVNAIRLATENTVGPLSKESLVRGIQTEMNEQDLMNIQE